MSHAITPPGVKQPSEQQTNFSTDSRFPHALCYTGSGTTERVTREILNKCWSENPPFQKTCTPIVWENPKKGVRCKFFVTANRRHIVWTMNFLDPQARAEHNSNRPKGAFKTTHKAVLFAAKGPGDFAKPSFDHFLLKCHNSTSEKQFQLHENLFRKEIEILYSLQDAPGIAKCVDHFFYKNRKGYTKCCLIMPYYPHTLQTLLNKGPLTTSQARQLQCTLLEGARALRTKGIVHRDLKLANILITKEGEAKITDFGLSATLPTTTIDWGGAVYCAAPECAVVGKELVSQVTEYATHQAQLHQLPYHQDQNLQNKREHTIHSLQKLLATQTGPANDTFALGLLFAKIEQATNGNNYCSLFFHRVPNGPLAEQTSVFLTQRADLLNDDRSLQPLQEAARANPKSIVAIIEQMTKPSPENRCSEGKAQELLDDLIKRERKERQNPDI